MKKVKMKTLIMMVVLLMILILVVGGIYLLLPKKSNYVPFEVVERTSKVDATKIAESPAVGWIRVQGTNVDYPIIYETPNAYRSGEDYTWVAHRPGKGENRLAIYGHNVQNVSSEPIIGDPNHVRFEQLMGFVYYDFAKNNLYIQYTHNGVDEVYKIYAVGFVDDNEQGDTTESAEEVKEYIASAKENSLYKYDIDVNENDTILSLITCTRYFGKSERMQFRIDARKVREGENYEKYSVQTTKNYDIIK